MVDVAVTASELELQIVTWVAVVLSNDIVGAAGTGYTVTVAIFDSAVQPSKSCSSSAFIE